MFLFKISTLHSRNLGFFIILIVLRFLMGCNIQEETKTEKLNHLISETFNTDQPGVALLISKADRVFYENAIGKGNLETDDLMSSNSVFKIASLTKQFTAAAIMLLEEQNKISLNDTISKYIPEFTNGNQITIHHLLNHTSGIVDYASLPDFESFQNLDLTPIEIINKVKDLPLEYEPGTQFQYNNSGYIILGHIIEKVLGKSYGAFLEEHIFTPLGMTNSYFTNDFSKIPTLANGYSFDNDNYKKSQNVHTSITYAAGGILSTVQDLQKWHAGLNNGSIINKVHYAKMTDKTQLDNNDTVNYGYGFHIGKLKGQKIIEHSGIVYGYSSSMMYLPEEDLFIVALSNTDNPNYNIGGFVQKAASIMLDDSSAAIIQLTEQELKKWEGEYVFEDGVKRKVFVEDGKLYSQREGAYKSELSATAIDAFLFSSGSTYKFLEEENGIAVVFTSSSGEVVNGRISK